MMSCVVFRTLLCGISLGNGKILQRFASNVKLVAELQRDVEEQIRSHNVKIKNHPGKRKTGCVTLPDQLVQAVEKIAIDFNRNTFEEAKRLNNQLYSRRPAIERQEYISRAKLLLAKKFRGDPEQFTDEQILAVSNKVKDKLKQETERWKPITYDEHTSKVHLIARLAPNFAVTSWVFSEIKQCLPSFVPKTFLDFGSGVGSAVWAAHKTWGTEIEEYFCVDSSSDMNNLAECLLKGDGTDSEEETLFKTLYFRQFLPTSNKIKYDLVVSAFSMMELPSLKERMRIVDILWQKTTDTLVLIENGSFAGYSMVMDARDYILHIENKKGDDRSCTNGAYVVAPCPHDMPCPKIKQIEGRKPVPCNFKVKYKPLFHCQGHSAANERFSFVVLRKKQRKMDAEYWPRVLETVIRSRHVRCHLCCSDGELQEVIFTKAKNTRDTYRCARTSSVGDLLPVSLSTVLKGPEESEEESQEDFEFTKRDCT